MKGLQNGIPIAMLAAMASAQGLGGRPKVDTGNGVGVGFSNHFSNEVNNFNKDDHSADVHTETNIIKAPPHPHGGQHGPEHGGHDGHGEGEGAHGHQKRGGGVIDSGNSASFDFDNEFTNEVNNFNKDDHSADVHTETNIIKAPSHPHGGQHGPEHGGHDGHGEGEGEHGHQKRGGGVIDSGNSASFDFDNEFTNEVNNANIDDHSLDVHENTNIVTPPPHPHGHGGHGPEHKRRDEEEPHGPTIDTGNDADFDFTNEFHNEVNNYNEDNHSVDVAKHTNVHVAPPHGGPHESHGHDGQEGHHKRAYRPDADSAAEPGKVDTGNTANTQVSNSVDSKTNSANIDDHSVKVHSDVNETVGAPHHHEHHEGGHEEPGENHQEEPSEPAEDDQEEPSEPADHQEEPSKPVEHQPAQPVEHPQEEHKEPVPTCTTLTREVVHTVVRTLQGHSEPTHAPQQPAEVNTPAAQPEEPKEHGESGHGDPSHQAETPKPTGSDGSHQEESGHDDHSPKETPKPTGADGSHQEDSGHAEPSHAAESPKPTGADGSHQEESGDDDHSPKDSPKSTGDDGSPHGESGHDQGNEVEDPKPTGVDASHHEQDPSSHEEAQSSNAYGPASTPAHGQPQQGGDDDSHFDVPSSTTLAHIAITPTPTHAPSHLHAVLTSTETVSRSSVHVVPIYVPSSSGAHVAETPGATPSAHVPIGVDAEHSSHVPQGPATPSPSHHEVMFQGGAASLSPSAGVISLACGVIGLLAYVL
ncbi:hypothetical protein APSETT445_008866 [Aspergillus pseudonomiae]